MLLRCGGDDTAKFTGTWNVSEIVTITCDGSTPTTVNDPQTVTFTAVGSRLESRWFDWTNPCDFQWSVDGDTASLSNAPVNCSDVDGMRWEGPYFTFTSVTVTMSADGLHLTAHMVGTQTILGTPHTTCAVDITSTGAR